MTYPKERHYLNGLHSKYTFIVIVAVLALFFSVCGCQSPEKAAKEYCECLKKNYPDGMNKQRIHAQKCNQIILKKYYYHWVFSLSPIDSLRQAMNQSTIDSAISFEMQFWNEADNYCCKETWRCE